MRAGVSVATVSNVLNRPEIVAQPARDRVQPSIRELGFVRNESARQLRAGRSRTIGLVVLDVANLAAKLSSSCCRSMPAGER